MLFYVLFYLADPSLGYGPVLFHDILFYLADPSLGYGPVLFHDILFYLADPSLGYGPVLFLYFILFSRSLPWLRSCVVL